MLRQFTETVQSTKLRETTISTNLEKENAYTLTQHNVMLQHLAEHRNFATRY